MNMTQIAQLAGVSQATVSRVLNGSRAVSRAKREHVLKIVQESGLAIRGVPQDTNKIKIGITSWEDDAVNPGILLRKYKSLARTAETNDLVLLKNNISAEELSFAIRHDKLNGLLLVGHSSKNAEIDELLNTIPHVWLNSHQSSKISMVLAGNEAAGRMAADYLTKKKCQHPAVLLVPSDNPGLASRISGFRFEFFASNRDSKVISMNNSMPNFESLDNNELESYLSQVVMDCFASQIDGIFIPDDLLTTLLYRVWSRIKKDNNKLPVIISCNNESEYLVGLYPRPATIDLAPELTAKMALEQLIHIIQGEQLDEKVTIMIRPELIPGENDM